MTVSQAHIPMEAIDSSQIVALGHDPETNRLAVQFKSGGIYYYGGVDASLYGALRHAKSVGQFFHQHIRVHADHYPFVRIETKEHAR